MYSKVGNIKFQDHDLSNGRSVTKNLQQMTSVKIVFLFLCDTWKINQI